MNERRKSPRVNKILPVKLSDADFDILTETKNISASGAYCSVNRPLEPMTKLKAVLLITQRKNKLKTVEKICCSAVVVRTEHSNDDPQYPYRIGIYFTNLKERDKKTLRAYVNSLLKK